MLSADLTRPLRRMGCLGRAGPPRGCGLHLGAHHLCCLVPFLVWLGMSHHYHSSLPGLDVMIHRLVNLTSRWQQEVGSGRRQGGSRRLILVISRRIGGLQGTGWSRGVGGDGEGRQIIIKARDAQPPLSLDCWIQLVSTFLSPCPTSLKDLDKVYHKSYR